MLCPKCGGTTQAPAGSCTICGSRIHDDGVTVAAGVLTPPISDQPTIIESEQTRLAEEPTRLAEEPTRLAESSVRSTQHGSGAPGRAPLTVGQQFGPRYQILRMLGVGGMGAVYQAWDEELGVAVALKVVRPEITANPIVAAELGRRFKRELLLAREVTHKNVVRIHDLGEIDGIKYITMSYVDGADLATLLKKEGRLPVPRALRIARNIVAGLQAAHEAGVVHRDLKPANVMVDEEDCAQIMDFGIARSTLRAGHARHRSESGIPGLTDWRSLEPQTMAGAVVGTVEYMAPEQARAQPADHRADIYAFGLILYDMLLGGRLGSGAHTALDDLTRRMTTPPPSAHSIDPTIPAALDQVISRCVEPDPAARYQTTAELVADLDRLDADGHRLPVLRRVTRRQIAAAGVLVLSLLAGTWWIARGPALEVVPDPKSVLIADFDNRTGDPVFDGALEQGLKIGIENASFLTAYSRTDAQTVANRLKAGSRLDESMARLVARSEGIHVILAGTISLEGSTYRITVRALDAALLDPAQNKPLATASAEAKTKAKVLEATGSLASDLREALGYTTPESTKLAAAETFTAASLDAMRAYARGQAFHDTGQYNEAIEAYKEAATFDEGFGRAYAAMGSAYGNLKRFDEAEVSYKKALKLINRMTEREKYRTYGVYYLLVSRNYDKAIENFEALVGAYPADEGGYLNLAFAYLLVRNFDKAVFAGRKATEIQPKSVLARTNYAMYAMYASDFKTSIREANVALKENPSFEFALLTVARSSVAAGDFESGRKAYEGLAALSEAGATMARLGQADLEMYLGRYKEAAALLEATISAGGKSQDPADAAPQYLALSEAYEASGKRAQAIRAATRAIELSRHESVLFPAALVLIRLGQPDKAQKVAETLHGMLQAQTSSFGHLIEGEIALTRKRLGDAVESLREGLKRYDSWFAHFLLGRAYLEAKSFPEALSEFELCVKRKGEATDVFFLDASTIRYFPPAYYWLGRAQEGVDARDAARKSYDQFLGLRPADTSDSLAADARKRLQKL